MLGIDLSVSVTWWVRQFLLMEVMNKRDSNPWPQNLILQSRDSSSVSKTSRWWMKLPQCVLFNTALLSYCTQSDEAALAPSCMLWVCFNQQVVWCCLNHWRQSMYFQTILWEFQEKLVNAKFYTNKVTTKWLSGSCRKFGQVNTGKFVKFRVLHGEKSKYTPRK